MAYNYGFPATYQPLYQPVNYSQQLQQPQIPQPLASQTPNNLQTNSGIIWVQGEAGAKAYPVAAGTSVLLMDSEGDVFYIKSTAQSGMPMPLQIFDYKERTNPPTNVVDVSTNTTTEHLEHIEKRIDELETKIKSMMEAKHE